MNCLDNQNFPNGGATMYEKIFRRIVDASQNNSLTFFVGAGVSAVSGAPKWSDLIEAMCNELGCTPKSSYISDEYLRIPQMFYYSINQDNEKYYSFITRCFEKSKLYPNIIHKMLLCFNPCSFITTNFDELLEEAAVQSAQGFKSIACDTEISSINGDRYILKLHGDLNHRNIVFKEEDYLNYSENFKLIETVLKAIFSMNTVVFIGYGLNDYNIKLILNWAKTLLKDQFNEPIFIHTGSEELSREELLYQESKGVKVVECKKCAPDLCEDTPYIDRYKYVLQAINTYSTSSFDGKNDIEAFNILYELLQPLNQLNALRIQDVHAKIGQYVYIGANGVISLLSTTQNILNFFIKINSLSEEDRTSLETSILEKYKVISAVFTKARITHIDVNHSYVEINSNSTFADPYCISFDYCKMNILSQKRTTDKYETYKKAYYLARLMRYDEAYFMFLDVANKAFKGKDYLLYYLAQINCNNLHTIMQGVNKYYRCYDMSEVEKSALNDKQVEHLFDRLPVEFRNTYSSLKDLNTPNLLYQYSYYAFIDGKKLQNAIESNSLEMGPSSIGKAMCRINDYLHFLLANGLLLDTFEEFKTTVSNLMSLLVYKYSEQSKKKLSGDYFSHFSSEKVVFDEIDFYCFIEYFNSSSILKLLNKYNIDTIEFENIDVICNSIDNLIDYYKSVLSKSKSFIEIVNYQVKLKTCLTLLRFMEIPQKTVDNICQFIFSYEFREILIDDKILFLDRQLRRKGKYSLITSKIIEDTLIGYIDTHIKSIETGFKFEVMSTCSNINYYNLVHYISQESNYHSRRLALRVAKILKLGNSTLLRHTVMYYVYYISAYQRSKVITWAKNSLEESFDFQLLLLLINYNARISDNIINNLCDFLHQRIADKEKSEVDSKTVQVYPTTDYYTELNQVAYWCFLGKIKKEKFTVFLGKSDLFDFFYLYNCFDFLKFDVSWLLHFHKTVLAAISQNMTVRGNIRLRISDALVNKHLSCTDEIKLSKILAEYFC